MKDIFILGVSLLALVFFTGCTMGVNRLKTEKEWTKFVGKEVQEVKTIYPCGDTPNHLILLKEGTKKI